MFVYLDNSATTRQYDQVTKIMKETMEDCFGNPSSLHSLGLAAEKAVRGSRRTTAAALGAKEEEIIFNSGGTEGDNTVLYGIAHARRREGKKIITSEVEHPAVLEACRVLETEGFQVEYIGVDGQCRLDMERLAASVDDGTTLISIMAVNNETGVKMPISEIAKIKGNAVLHTDAVQAFGKIDLKNTGADFITVSGHKIHGPKGTGALYARRGVRLPAFIAGGGQERGMRSGTENVPGITGFGKAVETACGNLKNRDAHMAEIRAYLLDGLRTEISDIRLNGPQNSSEAVSSVLNISFMGTRGEVILHTLEQDNIFVSTGSACSSNKKGQSHVLSAMGLSPKEIEGAIRFSFSEFNTLEEMDYVIGRVKTAVAKFRRLGSFR